MRIRFCLALMLLVPFLIDRAYGDAQRDKAVVESRTVPVSATVNIKGTAGIVALLNHDEVFRREIKNGSGAEAVRLDDWLVRGSNVLEFNLIGPVDAQTSGAQESRIEIEVVVGTQKFAHTWPSSQVKEPLKIGLLWLVELQMPDTEPPFAFENSPQRALDDTTRQNVTSAVHEIWAAYNAKDIAKIKALSETRFSDYSVNHSEADTNMATRSFAEFLTSVFSDPTFTLAPLEESTLRVEPRAGGKVWKVTQEGKERAISFNFSGGLEGGFEVFLADVGGKWVWIR